ncbi:FAD:protein FMN transferase [Cryobacterium sp. 1639]|uniref:FAD:protein FMN transferase n=1 Tax=Cryobacterium inferilacus TaxID=2866629 RepID=UPI001C733B8F|nr:FAD:protein FMN transferase [Cryobacterium sp. 1639]MBX0301991.1 FAD:protein FMN transferase [Cryobacterium sp. 1639]
MGVHVFDTMGTTVSLRFAGATAPASVLDGVEGAFRAFDERFSLYRTDSEISRVARGELPLTRTGAELREAYAEALDWSRSTDGAFTPHRPDGVIDLSGTVKAKAMEAAARVLDSSGEADWMLVAGGDILTRGTLDGLPWRAGVVDPDDRGTLLCAVELVGRRIALATSGTAERGEHIWRTGDPRAPQRYRQVTVLADDIVTADVLATALVAGGPERCPELLNRFDIEAITVDNAGNLTATPGLQSAWGLTPA